MQPKGNGKGQKATICELRYSGHTLAPGSTSRQSDGQVERVRWEADGDGYPATIAFEKMEWALERVAAASLIARYWSSGIRHIAALPLAGLLYHGGLSEEEALRFVRAVCAGAREDMEATANRVQCVVDTYARGRAGETVTGGPTLADYIDEKIIKLVRKWLHLKREDNGAILGPDGFALADDGDGERFAKRWEGRILYCVAEDTWYLYDGVRWCSDADIGEVKERAKVVVAEFRRVVGASSRECGQGGVASYEKCVGYSLRMGNEKQLNAMLKAASTLPQMRITPDEFDADDWQFNVLNGTLHGDPATGEMELYPHNPADRIRSLAPVTYETGATHRLFTQYLDRFFPEDDRRSFCQEAWGYALSGEPKRHAVQLIGAHDAGKTSTLKMLFAVWGDYAGSLPASSIARAYHKGGDVGRPDLWRVRHKRVVTVSEVGPDDHLDVAFFKACTSGGDPTGLRTFFDAKGGDDVVFHFALWMSGNRPYGPPPAEEAAFARLDVLACDHVVPEDTRIAQEERDTADPAIIGAAALAFAVEGFKRLYGQKDGVLSAPESSQTAKSALRNALDVWTDTLETLFAFGGDAGDAEDGVRKAEAWQIAQQERKRQESGWWPTAADKAEFADAMLRHRAVVPYASLSKFKNQLARRRVRWTAEAVGRYGHEVTLPTGEKPPAPAAPGSVLFE
jgi:phage/plasmid-associated DNA primase